MIFLSFIFKCRCDWCRWPVRGLRKTSPIGVYMIRLSVFSTVIAASLFAIGVLPSAPALSQPALTDEAVLKTFTPIAERYEKFFAAPHYLVDKQAVSWTSSGAYFVWKYAGSHIAYDVEKTASLVSPYLAHVDIEFSKTTEQDKCGSLKVGGRWGGFQSVTEANASIGQPQCEKTDAIHQFTDPVRFSFAFQGGKWVFKDAIRLQYQTSETILLTAISQTAAAPSIPVSAGEAPVNADWAALH